MGTKATCINMMETERCEPIEIVVGEGIPQDQKMSFVGYMVSTSTHRDSFNPANACSGRMSNNSNYKFSDNDDSHQYEALRRYSDFHWLAAQLRAYAPHVPLPPLPPKAGISGTLSRHEVSLRRLLLWRFLNKVGAHPTLSSLKVFRDFLTREYGFNHGDGYTEAPAEGSPAPVKKTSWLNKMKAKVASTPADLKLYEHPSYENQVPQLKQLGDLLQNTLLRVRLSQPLDDVADATAAMCDAFIQLTTSEESHPSKYVFQALARVLKESTRVRDMENETFTCQLVSTPAQCHEMLVTEAQSVMSARAGALAGVAAAVGQVREDGKEMIAARDELIQEEFERLQQDIARDLFIMVKAHATARKRLVQEELQYWDGLDGLVQDEEAMMRGVAAAAQAHNDSKREAAAAEHPGVPGMAGSSFVTGAGY